jgi:Flp pilus assembly protein TadB
MRRAKLPRLLAVRLTKINHGVLVHRFILCLYLCLVMFDYVLLFIVVLAASAVCVVICVVCVVWYSAREREREAQGGKNCFC